MLALSLSFVLNAAGAGVAARQTDGDAVGFVNIALPASGEVLVENRRGGVQIEVWNEDQIALSAAMQGQAKSARLKLPVSIERGDGALVIKVGRAALANPPRVDLKLRVPVSARLKVYTSDGELEVSGVPASLVAQTISGDLRLAIPARSDASLTAQSLNGSVVLGDGVEAEGARARTVSGKFQTRLGAGSRNVNLFSGRGHIVVSTLAGDTSSAEASGAGARETSSAGARPPRVSESQDDGAFKSAAPKPQPTETPQEVDEDDVVRVESDLVTVNVSVVDRASGRGLTGLATGDFRLYEDNVEQHIEHFESAEAPFDLVLLLDLSGSTARVTDTIRAAARRFVAATRQQDRIAIITFAGETNVVSPPTSDRAALASAIDRIASPKGDTKLYDSLAYALDYVNRSADPTRRRAIILMSDGLDSTLPNVTGAGSALPFEEVRDRVQEFDGVVYSVWTSTEYEAFSPEDIQPETFDLAHDRLKEFADAGGGVFYEVEKLDDLAGAYERVVADLGTVYSLSYRPTNKLRDATWRAIRVRIPRLSNAVARGRRGYFAK
ncbi:MAG TPA: VWA domain-containing protein [Pyrinomonadaceae bacterium]|nr:VWA domain-containing protein [Pyrinomonadaceae bacterium]